MIARFERSVRLLVAMATLAAVIATVFPNNAVAIQKLAAYPDETSPASVVEPVSEVEPAGRAGPALSAGAEGHVDHSRLPGLVIAGLIFGIAVFSAWKLPMSSGVRGSPPRMGDARDAAEPLGAPRGSDGSGDDSANESVPNGTAGTEAILPVSRRDQPEEARGEGPLEALTGELGILRRVVEEQDRRLAVMEEENLKLRRKLEAWLSWRSTFQELWTTRAVNERLRTRSRKMAAVSKKPGNGEGG